MEIIGENPSSWPASIFTPAWAALLISRNIPDSKNITLSSFRSRILSCASAFGPSYLASALLVVIKISPLLYLDRYIPNSRNCALRRCLQVGRVVHRFIDLPPVSPGSGEDVFATSLAEKEIQTATEHKILKPPNLVPLAVALDLPPVNKVRDALFESLDFGRV